MVMIIISFIIIIILRLSRTTGGGFAPCHVLGEHSDVVALEDELFGDRLDGEEVAVERDREDGKMETTVGVEFIIIG